MAVLPCFPLTDPCRSTVYPPHPFDPAPIHRMPATPSSTRPPLPACPRMPNPYPIPRQQQWTKKSTSMPRPTRALDLLPHRRLHNLLPRCVGFTSARVALRAPPHRRHLSAPRHNHEHGTASQQRRPACGHLPRAPPQQQRPRLRLLPRTAAATAPSAWSLNMSLALTCPGCTATPAGMALSLARQLN